MELTKERDRIMRELQEKARKDPLRYPGGVVPADEVNAALREVPRYQTVIEYERVPGTHQVRKVERRVKIA